jgi:hypothetical protein
MTKEWKILAYIRGSKGGKEMGNGKRGGRLRCRVQRKGNFPLASYTFAEKRE